MKVPEAKLRKPGACPSRPIADKLAPTLLSTDAFLTLLRKEGKVTKKCGKKKSSFEKQANEQNMDHDAIKSFYLSLVRDWTLIFERTSSKVIELFKKCQCLCIY